MGCAFCASTLHGLARNLTVGEIAAQVIGMADYLRQEGARVDTIVVMGSGEPMENYDNVIGALRLLHAEETIGLSYRGMTLSTSGIVPGILRLAEEGLPISLSISLHAPTEELRSSLMPVNRMYPMAEVLRAAELYAAQTKRRVTYEYILIRDVNDGVREAEQLARLLRGQLAILTRQTPYHGRDVVVALDRADAAAGRDPRGEDDDGFEDSEGESPAS